MNIKKLALMTALTVACGALAGCFSIKKNDVSDYVPAFPQQNPVYVQAPSDEVVSEDEASNDSESQSKVVSKNPLVRAKMMPVYTESKIPDPKSVLVHRDGSWQVHVNAIPVNIHREVVPVYRAPANCPPYGNYSWQPSSGCYNPNSYGYSGYNGYSGGYGGGYGGGGYGYR